MYGIVWVVADQWGEAIISCLKPMPIALPTDSDVKDDLEKEQINAPVTILQRQLIILMTMVEAEVEVED